MGPEQALQTIAPNAVLFFFSTQFLDQTGWNTIWLFNIAMENGPFIDGLPGFTY